MNNKLITLFSLNIFMVFYVKLVGIEEIKFALTFIGNIVLKPMFKLHDKR